MKPWVERGVGIITYDVPETRGLCLCAEQTISTILRRPRSGAGNQVFGMRTEPYKPRRHCEVTAILILYGFPRLLTGSILANEMVHAWLRLNGYRNLRQDVEEGICQVMAIMWLVSQSQSSSDSNKASTSRRGPKSPFERKLGMFFKNQIATDTSEIYGNGFRAANQAVLKFGLRRSGGLWPQWGDRKLSSLKFICDFDNFFPSELYVVANL